MALGRPSDYSLETAATICARLAAGESLVRICRDDDMPAVSAVYMWLIKHAEFAEMYARAREHQADTLADEILDIAEEEPGTTTTDRGTPCVDGAAVQHQRMRVDARKWIAAKLKPRKYGDKVTNELTTPDGKPPVFRIDAPWMAPSVGERNA